MKICKKCNIEKSLENFGKNKSKKDDIDIYCKSCNIEKTRNLYNKERSSNYNKRYRMNNSEKCKERDKKYYELNKEKIKKNVREYGKNNRAKISDKGKKYRQENKDKIIEYQKVYRKNNKEKHKKYFTDRVRNKRKSDPLYKLTGSIRHSISEGLKRNGYLKKSKTSEILGCSFIDLKIYLEAQFIGEKSWMKWENHGKYNGELNYGWDIDHIIPLNSSKDENELLKLCNYKNLQPLCSYTNRYIKRNLIL